MPISNSRYISRLTRDTLALVLAGGRGSRLHKLTSRRAKPAVFVGGKFRIIDFPLSNCRNSGIRRISKQTKTDDSIVTGNCIINNASLERAILSSSVDIQSSTGWVNPSCFRKLISAGIVASGAPLSITAVISRMACSLETMRWKMPDVSR